MAILIRELKQQHTTQTKAEEYAATITHKPRPGWTIVPVAIRTEALPIAHAIAAAFTNYGDEPQENPFTVAQILEMALHEGLAHNENLFLETGSLGQLDNGEQLPATTPMMLALVAAAIKEMGFGELPRTDEHFREQMKMLTAVPARATDLSPEERLLAVPVGSLWRRQRSSVTYRVLRHEGHNIFWRNAKKKRGKYGDWDAYDFVGAFVGPSAYLKRAGKA